MPTTIYIANNSFPIENSASTSIRPSGLIEISATYLVEKKAGLSGLNVGNAITVLGKSGEIVSSQHTSRTSDILFDEVQVAAYGLGTPNNNTEISSETLEISITRGQSPDAYTVNETWVCDVATQITAITGTVFLPNIQGVTLNKNMIRRWAIGAPTGAQPQPITITWDTGIRNVTRNVYGNYSEVTMVYGYFPKTS